MEEGIVEGGGSGGGGSGGGGSGGSGGVEGVVEEGDKASVQQQAP